MRRDDIRKVSIIGSEPIVIGLAGRNNASKHRIPSLTTLAAAAAVGRGIEAARNGRGVVKSVQ